MYADYIANNATINAARQQANSIANEYDWVFNNFLRANNGDVLKSNLDMDSYLYNRYTGFNNAVDYANAKNNK